MLTNFHELQRIIADIVKKLFPTFRRAKHGKYVRQFSNFCDELLFVGIFFKIKRVFVGILVLHESKKSAADGVSDLLVKLLTEPCHILDLPGRSLFIQGLEDFVVSTAVVRKGEV